MMTTSPRKPSGTSSPASGFKPAKQRAELNGYTPPLPPTPNSDQSYQALVAIARESFTRCESQETTLALCRQVVTTWATPLAYERIEQAVYMGRTVPERIAPSMESARPREPREPVYDSGARIQRGALNWLSAAREKHLRPIVLDLVAHYSRGDVWPTGLAGPIETAPRRVLLSITEEGTALIELKALGAKIENVTLLAQDFPAVKVGGTRGPMSLIDHRRELKARLQAFDADVLVLSPWFPHLNALRTFDVKMALDVSRELKPLNAWLADSQYTAIVTQSWNKTDKIPNDDVLNRLPGAANLVDFIPCVWSVVPIGHPNGDNSGALVRTIQTSAALMPRPLGFAFVREPETGRITRIEERQHAIDEADELAVPVDLTPSHRAHCSAWLRTVLPLDQPVAVNRLLALATPFGWNERMLRRARVYRHPRQPVTDTIRVETTHTMPALRLWRRTTC